MTADQNRAEHLATTGIAGLLNPDSHVERLQEKRDRDRCAWLGVPCFTRPPTPTEQVLIATLGHVSDARWVTTRVDVRGGLYRRSWPTLRHSGSPAR
ncbi:hypothetical protein [Mycolicibacterium gilvum]|uniref:hypothetical protein n=1 Tax=Mycolicibacterium gilvum TaxID=1804 RepID=UPI0013015B98|nr:hypothetical protein [Mycolicibacterium gilvum]